MIKNLKSKDLKIKLRKKLMYFNLLKKLSNFDRNHNSKDIWNTYKLLNKFYKGARLIKFKSPKEINKWKMIP